MTRPRDLHRVGRPRSATIAATRSVPEAFAELFGGATDATDDQPRTRRDCLVGGPNEARPCPWVSCRHHLYLDVHPESGSIKLNFPDVAPGDLDRLVDTCALDAAERGALTLEEVGARINLTRERVAQLEGDACAEAGAKLGAE